MSTLKKKYIPNTYGGLIHHNEGEELPETGRGPFYDGVGNRAGISIGRRGEGIKVDGKLKVGNLTFPNTLDGAKEDSIMVHLSANELALRDLTVLVKDVVDYMYPVGSVVMSINNVNPSIRFLGTTWEQIAKERAIVGVGDSGFTVGSNGDSLWEKEIDLPPHYHGVGRYRVDIDGGINSANEKNDDPIYITAKDQEQLPEEGWKAPNGERYIGRWNYGYGNDTKAEYILKHGGTRKSALITTTQYGYGVYGEEPTFSLDIKPPSYVVYVWKRTE